MEKVNTMQEQMGIISRDMERIKTNTTKQKCNRNENTCDRFHNRFKTALNQLASLKICQRNYILKGKEKRK